MQISSIELDVEGNIRKINLHPESDRVMGYDIAALIIDYNVNRSFLTERYYEMRKKMEADQKEKEDKNA